MRNNIKILWICERVEQRHSLLFIIQYTQYIYSQENMKKTFFYISVYYRYFLKVSKHKYWFQYHILLLRYHHAFSWLVKMYRPWNKTYWLNSYLFIQSRCLLTSLLVFVKRTCWFVPKTKKISRYFTHGERHKARHWLLSELLSSGRTTALYRWRQSAYRVWRTDLASIVSSDMKMRVTTQNLYLRCFFSLSLVEFERV